MSPLLQSSGTTLKSKHFDNGDAAKHKNQLQGSMKGPKLVIHFDVNETILIEDAAGGDTRDDCFNKILAKSAFVRKVHDGTSSQSLSTNVAATATTTPTQWWDGTPLTMPSIVHEEMKSSTIDNAKQMCSIIEELTSKLYGGDHWEWPEGCIPYYKALKGRSKTFTQHHGHIFQPLLEEMKQKLEMDPTDNIDPRLTAQQCATHQLLLPAFFHTLHYLEQSGRDYTVVIRTFGHDLIKVADAIDAFREGKHPLFPLEEDSSSNKNYHSLSRSHMFRGRYYIDMLEQDASKTKCNNKTIYRLHQWTDEGEELGTIVANNDEEILHLLENSSSSNNHNEGRIFGINDDYPFWSSHNNNPEYGKPVWVHAETNTVQPPPLHIMFDDNIKNDPSDSIVAIRMQQTFDDHDSDNLNNTTTASTVREHSIGYCSYSSIPGAEIQKLHGIHLVRVPTFKPILETDWFIKQIQQCEENYLSSLQS